MKYDEKKERPGRTGDGWVSAPAHSRGIAGDKRGKESLRDSELRYRRLFESAPDGILILDAGTGAIVDVNPFLA